MTQNAAKCKAKVPSVMTKTTDCASARPPADKTSMATPSASAVFVDRGAITALSDPASEFEETLHKMAGIAKALQCEISVPEVASP